MSFTRRLFIGVASVAIMLPSSAVAGPLLDLSNLAAPGYPVPSGHVLDVNDWLILDARDDNGWHLGWFMRNNDRHLDDRRALGSREGSDVDGGGGLGGGTRRGGGTGPSGTSPGGGTNPGGGTSGGYIPGPGAWVPTSDPIGDLPPGSLLPSDQLPGLSPTGAGDTAPVILNPEPASIVLLGSGLLMMARRLQTARARRQSHRR